VAGYVDIRKVAESISVPHLFNCIVLIVAHTPECFIQMGVVAIAARIAF
jgi:hypothetical protein